MLLALYPILLFSEVKNEDKPLKKIVFASCFDQNRSPRIWETVVVSKPELFLFMGDNIYADSIEDKSNAYQKLIGIPAYQTLIKSAKLITIWDDHDYGLNDSGSEYEYKKESKELFLKYFDEPQNSERRKREGLYSSYNYGPKGSKIKFIVLDLRTYRSPLIKNFWWVVWGNKYKQNYDPAATMLGDEQWSWLEKEFDSDEEITFLVSSIQFLNETQGFEQWANFPLEKEKLLNLILKKKKKNLFILSGDRHFAEFSMLTEKLPFPIYEFTASSLNRVLIAYNIKDNPLRFTKVFSDENFGTIDIDWKTSLIKFSILGIEGTEIMSKELNLNK